MFVYKLQDPFSFVDKVKEEEVGTRAQDGFTLNTHFFCRSSLEHTRKPLVPIPQVGLQAGYSGPLGLSELQGGAFSLSAGWRPWTLARASVLTRLSILHFGQVHGNEHLTSYVISFLLKCVTVCA